jgi:putative toxin-antitoxin system antitoxin component (TIGR02293 family)
MQYPEYRHVPAAYSIKQVRIRHICVDNKPLDSNLAAAYIAHMSRLNGSKETRMPSTNIAKERLTPKTSGTAAIGKEVSESSPTALGAAHSMPSLYVQMFRATPFERIGIIRKGVLAKEVVVTGEEMGIAKERMFNLLHFTRATVNRRLKDKEALPSEYSERIIGLQKLIGQVEVMVTESGDPSGFNAAHWVAEWLEKPIPALNHARPAEFMDTIEGQELVSSLLAKMQSGAYA